MEDVSPKIGFKFKKCNEKRFLVERLTVLEVVRCNVPSKMHSFSQECFQRQIIYPGKMIQPEQYVFVLYIAGLYKQK